MGRRDCGVLIKGSAIRDHHPTLSVLEIRHPLQSFWLAPAHMVAELQSIGDVSLLNIKHIETVTIGAEGQSTVYSDCL
jgi:hypothetical protein